MEIAHILFDQAAGSNWKVPLAQTRHHILLLVVKGKVTYTVGGEKLRLQRGDGLFMPQGVWREAHCDESDPQTMYSAHFNDLPQEELGVLLERSYRRFRPLGFEYVKQRFSVLNEVWIGQMPCYDMIARGILTEIIGLIRRELGADGLPSTRRSLAQRIQQYIVQHYREQIRLDDLARHVDRSPNYVSNVFKEVTGRTPVGYMHEVRVAAARELLLTTNMTIGEISESLGYCDQTYFNYIYKKIVGHPPSRSLKLGRAKP
ncbi:AraC family transcriptional regulator [Paenibacillus cymbidii]|uniref:AraC family transcriptional regulator n=1 Tax=Paenibacillus cymbidii TaxID=1639034 RepID=UPI0014369BE4|nr:AraC family transcriptional regulator [Paenibacillus cymbidii]